MSLKNRFTQLVAQFDRLGHMAIWAVLSLVLLLIVAPINPMLVGSYLWALCKICAAASLGYGFDWAAFRDADPAHAEGIERAMALTRRATLMAAAMIASGLIG